MFPLWKITGWHGPQTSNTAALVELLSGQPLGNLIAINTVSCVVNGQFHVRVTNITDEDVWLQPHSGIGVLHEINNVMDTKNTVDFKRVSINEEMVFVRESTTEQERTQRSVCPIDLSDLSSDSVLETCKCLYREWEWPWIHRNSQAQDPNYQLSISCTALQKNPTKPVSRGKVSYMKNSWMVAFYGKYPAPIVLVRKNDGSLRLCVD